MNINCLSTRHALSNENQPGRPSHVLQGLADPGTPSSMEYFSSWREQQIRLDQRQRKPRTQHQQNQHNHLPQPHGRRSPAHLHRDHKHWRPPKSIPHEAQRDKVQTTHRRPHNHEATQRIPTGNKKSVIRK